MKNRDRHAEKILVKGFRYKMSDEFLVSLNIYSIFVSSPSFSVIAAIGIVLQFLQT